MKRTQLEDVAELAAAMRTIDEALAAFPPEQQLLMIAGELGNVLCRLGHPPSRHFAIGMLGTALECAFDMIDRHFEQPEKYDA